MCGLCGIFGERVHWSTQGVAKGTSQRQRMFRVQALNHVLGIVHCKAQDFSGSDYVLAAPTGGKRLVKEMGQLWQELESLRGKPLDPLDAELIAKVREKNSCA